jgi:predicted dehydrogenase
MLRVAIVGCGKIADSHAAQLHRIRECEIVAACDTEPLMAQQLCERFAVKRYFSDLSEMLVEVTPDVVHVTTPPKSHFDIAKSCLERGCHVYVEKPFTVNEEEARRLISLARERGLKITAGHDDQFSHVSRRMRALVQRGFLGGAPLHMESYYCYQLGRTGYAGALLADDRHWVRRLPGKLLHNIISHGIARIAEFLTSESPHVMAYGFTSPMLKQMGEREIIDELRVIISEEERATAYFTFSSQMRPLLHQFRMYGPKNGVVLDQDQETLIKLRGDRFKSYVEKFLPPVIFAQQYFGNLKTNVRTFLRNDFQMKSGMKYLIEAFYRSIVADTAPPISYREILLTARIMDAIFEQLDRQRLRREPGVSIDIPTAKMPAEPASTARPGAPLFVNSQISQR